MMLFQVKRQLVPLNGVTSQWMDETFEMAVWTYDLFSGKADATKLPPYRTHVPGLLRCYIDSMLVSTRVFDDAIAKWGGGWDRHQIEKAIDDTSR